ncbi:MAG: [Fe-Fe] hydrogenase large subunit C-terminal domain-containing protein [Bacillota bacterium]
MKKYYHSVTLEPDYCNGCTHCLDGCPTEAIRVIDGKANIINELCIDCGECLKVCPFHAKGAVSDSLKDIDEYEYTVALPAISLYGQFSSEYNLNKMLNTFLHLGFDDVYDLGFYAEVLSDYQKKMIENNEKNLYISTYCPAITRLIQIKYPSLIENIIRLESPMEVAARIIKKELIKEKGLKKEDIGIFYISQCPAKNTSIKAPIGLEESYVDKCIAIDKVYSKIVKLYDDIEETKDILKTSSKGFNWGRVGGQSFSMGIDNYIAVDGINEVIRVLDEIELGKLKNIDFFEGYACVTGCVGGPLNVENPFIGKNNIRNLSQICKNKSNNIDLSKYSKDTIEWDKEIKPLDVMKLDDNFQKALKKMGEIEEIFQKLPQINCGVCGAPTCHAFAEDIVKGKAKLEECVVRKYRNKEENKDESK